MISTRWWTAGFLLAVVIPAFAASAAALPALTVTAPVQNAIGQPDVRVVATCTDDAPPCTIRVRPGNAAGVPIGAEFLAAAQNSMDVSVQPVGGASSLIIEAVDSDGDVVSVTRAVYVVTSQNLRPVAGFGTGDILAIDAARALLRDKTVSPAVLRLVNRASNASQIIWTGAVADEDVNRAFLTPTGAIFSTTRPGLNQGYGAIYEWRSGLAELAAGPAGALIAEGAWAIWVEFAAPCCNAVRTLVLRDLTAATNTSIATNTYLGVSNDVAANGYTVFTDGTFLTSQVYGYTPGASPSLSPLTTSYSDSPKTDGAHVVYRRLTGTVEYQVTLHLRTQAGVDVQLAGPQPVYESLSYDTANGWVAYEARGVVRLRAPDGTERTLHAGSGASLEALNGNGEVVYTKTSAGSGTTRYLVRPGEPAVDLGAPFGTPVAIGDEWFVAAGPHVFAIEPLPARSILAEGATGDFFTTDVAILNPNEHVVPATIKYLREGGAVIEGARQLAARSRTTIRLNEVPGLENASVSTVVDALDGSPLVVERLMSWDATGYGGHLGGAVVRPRARWLFAEGAQGGFDTFFLLANVETEDATVEFTHLVEQGTPVTRTITVPAGSRVTAFAGDVPALVNRSFATVIDSNVPIIAERAMYFGQSPLWLAGHGTAGVSQPATSWFHAEGATGTFFDTYILLGNPNGVDVSVALTFITDTNVTVTRTKTVPALGRLTVNIEDEAPAVSGPVATFVTASHAIVSERAMYWGPANLGWRETHDSFGATSPALRWGLAEGRAGGARGYQTYVLVSNDEENSTPLTATFIREDGQVIEKRYDVGAKQRLNIEASALPELANSNFATIIESIVGRPISVESAIYWSVDGVIWEGGGNTTATRLP